VARERTSVDNETHTVICVYRWGGEAVSCTFGGKEGVERARGSLDGEGERGKERNV